MGSGHMDDLQKALLEHQVGRDKYVVKEIEANCCGCHEAILITEKQGILFMPYADALLICPRMISPLKGRKTIRRNSTEGFQQLGCLGSWDNRLPLTLTMPVPWPIRPSEALSIS